MEVKNRFEALAVEDVDMEKEWEDFKNILIETARELAPKKENDVKAEMDDGRYIGFDGCKARSKRKG